MYFSIIRFCRGADVGFSLKSAAACTDWEIKDAVTLINLCGGLYQNWDILFEVIYVAFFLRISVY